MDEVLRSALFLALKLSDSRAATLGRAAWANIARDAAAVRSARAPADGSDRALVDILIDLRTPHSGAFDYHPVLYTYFLRRLARLSDAQIQTHLRTSPQLLGHYRALDICLRAITLVVGAIRRLGAGYPHRSLIYTEPMRIWSSLEKVCEVPWPETIVMVPASSASNLSELGLDRVLGEDGPPTSERLEELLDVLRTALEIQALNDAYGQVVKDGLLGQLEQKRAEFGVRYAALKRRGLQGDELSVQAIALGLELYIARRGPIRNYADAFEQFEKLVQRIYWLLSQLVFHRTISCLTTANPLQLQQALVFHEEEIYLTALAPTDAKTLHTGQLVHITLPELEGIYDGVFQVRRWNFEWDVRTGARVFVRLEPRWRARYDALTSIVGAVGPVFVPSEENPLTLLIDGISFSPPTLEGFGPPIRLRDMSSSFTMDESLSYPE